MVVWLANTFLFLMKNRRFSLILLRVFEISYLIDFEVFASKVALSSLAILKRMLFDHLREIEETANRRLEQIMKELLEKNPATDKKTHQMEWVQHMNALKAQAEEVILNELINS